MRKIEILRGKGTKIIEIHRSKAMVILEIDFSEFDKRTFDDIWDEVRDIYEENFYSVKKIEKVKNKMHIKLNILKIK